MIKNIKPRVHKESTEYFMDFRRDKSSGYSFPCDKAGRVSDLTGAAAANHRQCLTGKDYDGTPLVSSLRPQYSSWVEEAHGVCDCGREVVLSGFTNTCECGTDYNQSGQLLAPRSQWGCETGESLTDILNIQ